MGALGVHLSDESMRKAVISNARESGPIDLTVLDRLRNLGGNNLIGRMIDLFCSHAEPTLAKGVQAFETGDMEELERAVHSLKSSAANLGAREVENIAGTVEQLAAQGRTIAIRPLLADLEKAFSQAKRRLEEVREGLTQ